MLTICSSRRIGDVATWGLIVGASLCFGLGIAHPNIPRWFFVDAFGLAIVGLWLWRGGEIRLSRPHWLAIALLAWMGLSLLWSPDWKQGLIQWHRMAAMLVVFLAAPYVWGHVRYAVTLAYAGALGMAVIWENGGFGNMNFITEWLLIASPFVLFRPGLLLWPAAAVYMIAFNESKIEMAVLLGAIYGFIWWIWKSEKSDGFSLGLIVTFLVGVLIWTGYLNESIFSRLEAIINGAILWSHAPIAGHGLGSFNYVYAMVQSEHLNWFPEIGSVLGATKFMGHAHNEPLNLLIEGGAIAIVLASLLLCSIKGRDRRMLVVLGIASIIALLEFPLSNPHTAVLIALALGALAGKGAVVGRSRLVPMPYLAIVAAGVAHSVLLWQTFWWLGQGSLAEKHGQIVNAYSFVMKAHQTHDWPVGVRVNVANMFTRAFATGTIMVPREVGERMFAIGATVSPYSPALLLNRADYLMATKGDMEEVARIVAHMRREMPHLEATAKLAAKYEEYRDE